MKRNLLTLMIAGMVAAACLAGCGGKNSVDSAIDKIEASMKKIEKNKTSMTTDDWKAINAELEEPARVLKEAMDSDKVGALKKIRISAVLLKYVAVVGEAGIHTAAEELGKKLDEAKQATDE